MRLRMIEIILNFKTTYLLYLVNIFFYDKID